jgi:hypothetical protein
MGESSAAEVVAALAAPRFYPHRPASVEHVQTHISHVFLAGAYVYKLKKPVRFSFLDFGTRELRRHWCEEEVRQNRRLCPDVYLGVVPITRAADGALALAGDGEAVEHVVWMRRLPADRMLKALLARGAVEPAMIDRLAARMAAFHAGAPAGPEVAAHGAPEALAALVADDARGTAPFVGGAIAPEDHEVLADFGPRFIRRHETLLRARQQGGRIRDGHGDLHAEHVCFVDAPVPCPDRPPLPPGLYVFDCIEFSPALRANDVASEIAFLAMDLEWLGHPALARRLVASYAAAAADAELAVLVPFYACHRAWVRGRVEAMKSADPAVEGAAAAVAADEARRHLALAVRYAWQAGPPVVVACAGLSGTGKTTLARLLAEATGFRLVSTDVLRRRCDAPAAHGAYGAGRYAPAARAAVYAALVAEVEAALAAGESTIADATFLRRADRRRLQEAARRERRACVFLECRAAEAAVRARLGARDQEPSLSDARWQTYLGQRRECEPFGADEPRLVIDTGGSPADARAAAVRSLWRWRQETPLTASRTPGKS